ncbi:universal stress protein [Leptolyngbya sp. FACHB-261]|uniref:universal stress protein n=1 Tax=Leptolyngbya sp. FACHB-261 TaxID=2692806 RepID=UPI001687D7A0|nr:universal stress protein [Leptolyngbya sp. FACHB-261]MBD2099936.1 universal stress protein [Leptolyngbya sp. FACHB-261]
MLQNILLAVDGSGRSEQMFLTLLELPALQGRRVNVTALHVVSPQVSAEQMNDKRVVGQNILGQTTRTLNLSSDFSYSAVLKEGDPKDIVVKTAAEVNPDLIIMGSRGLGRIQSILKDSVSQYVFQLTSTPMLLVKEDIYLKKLNRVMVALNASEPSTQRLKFALSLMQGLKGGQLLLARVTEGKDQPANPEKDDPVVAAAINEAKKQGVAYKTYFGTGDVGREICRLADEANADLIVLGSPDRRPTIARGLPDLDRLLGNSISDYVRVNASCPVLLARTIGER